jgi:hypothetical protein
VGADDPSAALLADQEDEAVSKKPDDGGPAFPNVPDGAGDKWADWDKGMTLRDYFAAKALPAVVSLGPAPTADIAAMAYLIADAMLRARKT